MVIAIPSVREVGVWLAELDLHQCPDFPFEGDYAMMLVLERDVCSANDQGVMAKWIVRSGCRYAVCYGHSSSSWDDAIDMVGVMDEIDGREVASVTTTWHDTEELKDVVGFFADVVRIDGKAPDNYLVFYLGCNERMKGELACVLQDRFSTPSPW